MFNVRNKPISTTTLNHLNAVINITARFSFNLISFSCFYVGPAFHLFKTSPETTSESVIPIFKVLKKQIAIRAISSFWQTLEQSSNLNKLVVDCQKDLSRHVSNIGSMGKTTGASASTFKITMKRCSCISRNTSSK